MELLSNGNFVLDIMGILCWKIPYIEDEVVIGL
jgi:hypothetical protein